MNAKSAMKKSASNDVTPKKVTPNTAAPVTPKAIPSTAPPAEPKMAATVTNLPATTAAATPTAATTPTADGFSESGTDDRRGVIKGTVMRCVDGSWADKNDVKYDGTEKFLAIDVKEAVQGWRDNQLFFERVKGPGQPLPDVEELNRGVPESEWEDGLNGPRPPYSHVYICYLLNLSDGGIFTFLNSTLGARLAITTLRDKVYWMRKIRGNDHLYAVVTLGKCPMKTQKGIKQRPDLPIQEYRDFSSGTPEQVAQAKQEIGKPVAPATTKEIFDDEIPDFDDDAPLVGE